MDKLCTEHAGTHGRRHGEQHWDGDHAAHQRWDARCTLGDVPEPLQVKRCFGGSASRTLATAGRELTNVFLKGLAMKYVVSAIGASASIGLLAVFAGCASSSARFGQVVEPGIGTPFADFTYLDADGQPQTLAEHLGTFTILMFTKCGSEMHGSVPSRLTELIRDSQEPGVVKTVGFDIHWSEAGCGQKDQCHLVSKDSDVYSICDARGIVRTLYGADAGNQVFVIGPDHKIVDKGSLAQWDSLRSRIRDMERNYGRRVHRGRVEKAG
jgi:hypothetical protein